MAKLKSSKGAGSVPNKVLNCRASYLYQAATYFGTLQQHSKALAERARRASQDSQGEGVTGIAAAGSQIPSSTPFQPASRRLISDLRSVTLKVQLRMSPAMKHSLCKNCDTVLIDGSTCSNEVENKSKGGRKPWADVLVRRCNTCGFVRRFPLMAERQKRRPERLQQEQGRKLHSQGG